MPNITVVPTYSTYIYVYPNMFFVFVSNVLLSIPNPREICVCRSIITIYLNRVCYGICITFGLTRFSG